MKLSRILTAGFTLGVTLQPQAQGFVNLNFEMARLSTNGSPADANTTATIPGWSVNTFNYVNGDTNSVPYNDIALDAPSVDMMGTNPPAFLPPYYSALQGKYSILLQGGSQFNPPGVGGASISQTGQVPAGTESLLFWDFPVSAPVNTLQVSFDGQPLALFPLLSPPTHYAYAADISAFAGQTGPLVFSVPLLSEVMIDNLQFSTSPAPEPGPLALVVVGTLLPALRRWRK